LKDEIEEFSKPKESLDNLKTDNALILKKLKQDIIDLEINNNELRQQITEFENKHKDIQGKVIISFLLFYIIKNSSIMYVY
jgi:hypothetical protein